MKKGVKVVIGCGLLLGLVGLYWWNNHPVGQFGKRNESGDIRVIKGKEIQLKQKNLSKTFSKALGKLISEDYQDLTYNEVSYYEDLLLVETNFYHFIYYPETERAQEIPSIYEDDEETQFQDKHIDMIIDEKYAVIENCAEFEKRVEGMGNIKRYSYYFYDLVRKELVNDVPIIFDSKVPFSAYEEGKYYISGYGKLIETQSDSPPISYILQIDIESGELEKTYIKDTDVAYDELYAKFFDLRKEQPVDDYEKNADKTKYIENNMDTYTIVDLETREETEYDYFLDNTEAYAQFYTTDNLIIQKFITYENIFSSSEIEKILESKPYIENESEPIVDFYLTDLNTEKTRRIHLEDDEIWSPTDAIKSGGYLIWSSKEEGEREYYHEEDDQWYTLPTISGKIIKEYYQGNNLIQDYYVFSDDSEVNIIQRANGELLYVANTDEGILLCTEK